MGAWSWDLRASKAPKCSSTLYVPANLTFRSAERHYAYLTRGQLMTDETSSPINSDLVGDAAVLAAISGTDWKKTPGLTEQELIDAGLMEPPAAPVFSQVDLAPAPPRVQNWQPCTGSEITAMLRAVDAGFKRFAGFTQNDVLAFLSGKGL